MRRAVIAGLISALLAVTGATFVGGMFGLLFAQAQALDVPWEDVFTDERIPGAASLWGFLVMGLMVLGIIGSLLCGRIILMGLGVRNPMRTLRIPIILLVAGGLLTIIFTFPLFFIVVAVGVLWGIVRIYDEAGPKGTSALEGMTPIRADDEHLNRPATNATRFTARDRGKHPNRGGDMSDWS